jgi:hypothetical protein
MARCEANLVDFPFGMARNERLVGETKDELILAASDVNRALIVRYSNDVSVRLSENLTTSWIVDG